MFYFLGEVGLDGKNNDLRAIYLNDVIGFLTFVDLDVWMLPDRTRMVIGLRKVSILS
jgi:hypothetical protein